MTPVAHDGIRAAITGVGYATPARLVTSLEVEARITRGNRGGCRSRRARSRRSAGSAAGTWSGPASSRAPSAIEAGRIALDDAGVAADTVDLLVFASASHDQIEPATAHIVAEGLGVERPRVRRQERLQQLHQRRRDRRGVHQDRARQAGARRQRRDADARHAMEGRLAAGAAPLVHRLHDGRPRDGGRDRGRRRWPRHRLQRPPRDLDALADRPGAGRRIAPPGARSRSTTTRTATGPPCGTRSSRSTTRT